MSTMTAYSASGTTGLSASQLISQARDAAAPGVSMRLRSHVQELLTARSPPKTTTEQRSRQSVLRSFVHYVATNTGVFFRTLIVSPVSILFDPLSTIALLIIYPVIYTFLFLAIFALWAAGSLGGSQIIDRLSKKYGGGYSIVNWPSPELINSRESAQTIASARATLGGLPTTFPDVVAPGARVGEFSPSATSRIFDLDVAKTFLIFSALVYERNDKLVEKAVATAAAGDLEKAEAQLLESEAVIRDQATKWDLNYEGISDLSSTSGPFASVFYTKPGAENPFIVLVFKGTTPSDYAEFLVDATITRISATSWFGDGTVHEGFSTSLFPMYGPGKPDGYGQILVQLKQIAEQMDIRDRKIPLWLAGHSLGASLASLFYTRALRAPTDLPPPLELRDAMTFGCPRLGDGQFAAKFGESMLNPLNRPNIMWRVKNQADIVTRIPPGLGGLDSGMLGNTTSVLNYSHTGAEFYLTPGKNDVNYVADTSSFRHATRVLVVQEGPQAPVESARSTAYHKDPNPLRWAMCFLLPSFAFDHFPASYAQHLSQVIITGQGGADRGKSDEARHVGASRRPGVTAPQIISA